MIAVISQLEQGYLFTCERQFDQSAQKVWDMLTKNEQLDKWFPELRVGELRNGGFMKFEVPNEFNERLEIKALEESSVLTFDWFGDEVSFRLFPAAEGCLLIFTERVSKLTEQTKKDIAGWHVCLDVIKALLDGEEIPRVTEWRKWHTEYTRLLDEFMEEIE